MRWASDWCGSSAGQRGLCDLRRAQMVLLAAQSMNVPAIAKVAFTSEDRVRDVIRSAPRIHHADRTAHPRRQYPAPGVRLTDRPAGGSRLMA